MKNEYILIIFLLSLCLLWGLGFFIYKKFFKNKNELVGIDKENGIASNKDGFILFQNMIVAEINEEKNEIEITYLTNEGKFTSIICFSKKNEEAIKKILEEKIGNPINQMYKKSIKIWVEIFIGILLISALAIWVNASDDINSFRVPIYLYPFILLALRMNIQEIIYTNIIVFIICLLGSLIFSRRKYTVIRYINPNFYNEGEK